MVIKSREGHIGSSFSIVEMLCAVLESLRKSQEPSLSDIILSKGHASYAYYAVLKRMGKMNPGEYEEIGEPGSKLYGHLPFISGDSRFQFGSGSLGHGLPYSIGYAHSKALRGLGTPTFVIVGDGEANEGTFWESLLLLEKLGQLNLNILIDCNQTSERAIPIRRKLENLAHPFNETSFLELDGHDINEIATAMDASKSNKVLLCNTKKGFPVPFMINNPEWHHRIPNEHESSEIRKWLR